MNAAPAKIAAIMPPVLMISILAVSPSLLASGQMEPPDPDIEQTPFPPAIISGQAGAPEYTISIPHTSAGNPTYEPAEVGIPVGTTVMWINKDSGRHTVTTAEQGREFSPPESFDSGHILGRADTFVPGVASFGGSFFQTFMEPGVYDYFCTLHPGHTGRIIVGDTTQPGERMTMAIGANLPFNASELSRVLVAVKPSPEVVNLPLTSAITYNVTIEGPAAAMSELVTGQTAPRADLNLTSGKLYQTQFVDTDGVLYLELVPEPKVNSTVSNFVTWGPDVSGTATGRHTGAFHIKGPVLIQDGSYAMTVSIVAIDYELLDTPITERFVLSSQLANSTAPAG